MRRLKGKQGFTLIDVMVSVGIVSLLIVVITSILMDTFKAKTRVSIADTVERNGSFALSEIRRNIINSVTDSVLCPVGVGRSWVTVSGWDGVQTQLICNEGVAIASSSANGLFNLTDDNVRVTDCANFVTCTLDASSEVTQVNIGFGLESGVEEAGKESYVSKSFEMDVTVRN